MIEGSRSLSSLSFCRFSLVVACAILAWAISGCRPGSNSGTLAPVTNSHVVVDDTGRRIDVAIRPVRIVSLAPSLTEIVFAVGAGSRVVGDTTYCDYPEEARRVAKVGDTLHPNIETIISLRPDLVLISTSSQLEAFSQELDARHIPVFISDPKSFDSVIASISAIGTLLDEPARAKEVSDSLALRAKAVSDRVKDLKPVNVFYQVSSEPLYTAGHDSFVTDLIRRAGGVSVTEGVPGAWPRYSSETALASNPEAIVIPSGDSMGGGQELHPADVFRNSPAVRNGRVYKINGDLLSRPGPRLVDGLEEIAKALHPEIATVAGTPSPGGQLGGR